MKFEGIVRRIQQNPNILRWWQKLILVVVIMSLALFAVDLVLDFPHTWTVHIHRFNILTAVLLGIDLFYEYVQADTKKNFLKNHWLEVLAILPWGHTLKGVQAANLARASRAVGVVAQARRMKKDGLAQVQRPKKKKRT